MKLFGHCLILHIICREKYPNAKFVFKMSYFCTIVKLIIRINLLFVLDKNIHLVLTCGNKQMCIEFKLNYSAAYGNLLVDLYDCEPIFDPRLIRNSMSVWRSGRGVSVAVSSGGRGGCMVD